MRILVLGSGAREHAIIKALRAEDADHDIFVSPGNAGIAADAQTVNVAADQPEEVATFVADHDIDLLIIGPEAPLVAGVADAVRAGGGRVFGPNRAAAQLEGSKAFAKRVMDAAGVPTGHAVRAETEADIIQALDAYGAPYVVKADGLAAGKGVIVTDNREAALAHAREYLPRGPVLVEEFLSGPEVSLFFVSDGTRVVPLSPAQDFKRLGDGDTGPNTGGMGAYSPLPWLADQFGSEQAFIDEVAASIAQPVINQLAAEGNPFVGLLYAGLIVTDSGVKVIEFNVRFGDPETQVVLPRLATPLSELLFAAATGALETTPKPDFHPIAAVTVVLASEGYPAAPQTGRVLSGLDHAAASDGVHLVHAATVARGDDLHAAGGRVLNVVGTGSDIAQARTRAYAAMDAIELAGGQYRRDIAAGR